MPAENDGQAKAHNNQVSCYYSEIEVEVNSESF